MTDTAAPRNVITDGIVVRRYLSSLSSKATDRYTAHLEGCRYGVNAEPMADLVSRRGHDAVRTKILVGVIKPCAKCRPTLIATDA